MFATADVEALYELEADRWHRLVLPDYYDWKTWCRAYQAERFNRTLAGRRSLTLERSPGPTKAHTKLVERLARQAKREQALVEQQAHLARYEWWCKGGGGHMSPVGGSRHYGGPGLGDTLTWHCPSCGAENTGAITQGCPLCGAGRPGQRADAPPPPPSRSPAPPAESLGGASQGDLADFWASHHEGATLAEAYREGYRDGVNAAHATTTGASAWLLSDEKITRTIIAALALFRDQVLAAAGDDPDPEWLTAAEVNLLIERLQAGEVT